MKILVLQLTRPGDIFCTVPTLSALRRKHSEAEIHLLVRKKFSQAASVVKNYDHLWQMDAQKLLGDFIVGKKLVTDGITRLSEFVHQLKSERFDQIINLSFSPSSSFIAHIISEGGRIPVIGYTRTSDFYLAVPDIASRYFRAQCGLGKSNRVHIVDLLAEIAGVNLTEKDVHLLAPFSENKRSGICCHLGASQDHKTWSITSWVAFLNQVVSRYSGKITLIGAKEDSEKARELLGQLGENKIVNKVGQTSWVEVAEILKTSELFIGADSGPLQLASLCACRVLNLSVGNVRFWETGPTVFGSRVLRTEKPDHLMSDVVFSHFQQMLSEESTSDGAVVCTNNSSVRYSVSGKSNVEPDAWNLVNWMYFQSGRPEMSGELGRALEQIEEVVDIATSQIDALEKDSNKSEIIGVLDRLDEILEILRQSIPPLTPLLDEFRTNKENISPSSREEIFYQTRQCYRNLKERVRALGPKERIQGTVQEREAI